jgi:hypothetical protein
MIQMMTRHRVEIQHVRNPELHLSKIPNCKLGQTIFIKPSKLKTLTIFCDFPTTLAQQRQYGKTR